KAIDRIVDAFSSEQQNQIRSQLATVLEGIVSQQLIPRIDGKGLIAVSEVLIVNTAVRNLIREGKHYQINNLIQTGVKQGMVSMERQLAEYVKKNVISEEIARIKAADPMLFDTYLKQV
ncbi:MAG: type IV pili twitching motility protein PilT, partial [Vallitaleaceae bacterium]|nr:type IV pili twitching motility protein PilT [Vallitaleaceae bacterium]